MRVEDGEVQDAIVLLRALQLVEPRLDGGERAVRAAASESVVSAVGGYGVMAAAESWTSGKGITMV